MNKLTVKGTKTAYNHIKKINNYKKSHTLVNYWMSISAV